MESDLTRIRLIRTICKIVYLEVDDAESACTVMHAAKGEGRLGSATSETEKEGKPKNHEGTWALLSVTGVEIRFQVCAERV